MAFKWGNTEIYILPDTYTPPWAEVTLVEIKILPGTDNQEPSTVLQNGGRGRNRVNYSTYVKEYSTYQAMLTDYINQTERTFTGPDGVTGTYIISAISQAERKIYPTRFEFSLTLMEV